MWSQVGLRNHYDKASGGDGIPAEVFQIQKDDAVKMLYSIGQEEWFNWLVFSLYGTRQLDIHMQKLS